MSPDDPEVLPGCVPQRLSNDEPVEFEPREFVATGTTIDSHATAGTLPSEVPPFPLPPRASADTKTRYQSTIMSVTDSREMPNAFIIHCLSLLEKPQQELTQMDVIALKGALAMVDQLRTKIATTLDQVDAPRPSAAKSAPKKRAAKKARRKK